MAEHIVRDETFARISAHKEFKGFSQFLSPAPGGIASLMVKGMKLSGMKKYSPTWPIDDTVDGLNWMIDLVDRGIRVYYDIWSNEG